MPGDVDCASATLVLRVVPHPASRGETVPFFADWQRACRHLQDHLLSAPECYAWALVDPRYLRILDPADGKARYQYAQDAQESAGYTAQAMYDYYCAAVSRDARDAAVLKWHASQQQLTVAMGTSGVLLLIDSALNTAFLPSQGDPLATVESRAEDNRDGTMSRERGMRSGRRAVQDREMAERERRARERRELDWTSAQKLYYRVFKPAVQFVKRCQHQCRDMLGRLVRGDYALLKDSLPALSHLKYDDWLTLRQRCERGD